MFKYIAIFALLTGVCSTALAGYKLHKDIPYKNKAAKGFNPNRNILDVYTPKNLPGSKEVLIFIHGGSWNSGSKETYKFIGKRMAAKGKVAVIINYRLAQKGVIGYKEMAEDCASAIKWVHDSIAKYGGNPEKITISGHSAGAHLCAYVIAAKVYEKTFGVKDPVKGCILIDPFGLNMYDYLSKYKTDKDKLFYDTFTDNPEIWKDGSPMFAESLKTDIRFSLFCGSRTYPSIKETTAEYYGRLKQAGTPAKFEIINGRRHVGMIVQLFFPWNKLYKRIIPFIEK